MNLEEFIQKFTSTGSITAEHDERVPLYIVNPAHYQEEVVARGGSNLVYTLLTSDETGTINNIMLQLLIQSRVKSSSFRITQCYLAAALPILGQEALFQKVGKYDFKALMERYQKALKKAGINEPSLFENLDEISHDLRTISETWKLRSKSLDFEPNPHNTEQVNVIIRNARKENSYLADFYEHILSPMLLISVKK